MVSIFEIFSSFLRIYQAKWLHWPSMGSVVCGLSTIVSCFIWAWIHSIWVFVATIVRAHRQDFDHSLWRQFLAEQLFWEHFRSMRDFASQTFASMSSPHTMVPSVKYMTEPRHQFEHLQHHLEPLQHPQMMKVMEMDDSDGTQRYVSWLLLSCLTLDILTGWFSYHFSWGVLFPEELKWVTPCKSFI